MIYRISSEKTIKDLNDAFGKAFPFLKVEVIANARAHKPGVNRPIFCKHDLKLGTISKKLNGEVEFDIRPDLTVQDLERLFEEKYGLTVQVFRKSSGSWLETTATDAWTLEKQNEFGNILNTRDEEEIDEFDNDATK